MRKIQINMDEVFYNIYNEAYQSYLNNLPSVFFINTFLDKIIDATQSRYGFIATFTDIDDEKHMYIEAVCNKTSYDLCFPKNSLLKVNDTGCTCLKSTIEGNIKIVNDVQKLKHIKYTEAFHNVNTMISIPITFCNKTHGMICLVNKENGYNLDDISNYEILGNLYGTLYNVSSNVKKASQSIDNKFVLFQIIQEILNTTNDSIIVTDHNCDIIFNNNNAKLINERYTNMSMVGIKINHVISGLDVICNDDNWQKMYKNRKISFQDINITINSVMCNTNIYHVFTVCNEKLSMHEDDMYVSDTIQKSHNNFIAFLSHELRNPLQSITLSQHLLKKKIEKINDTTRFDLPMKLLNMMNKSCNDMKKIIDDILDLSRIESKEFSVDICECDVFEIVESIVVEYIEVANKKNISLKLNTNKKDVPQQLLTDEVRISQVITNLISNAVKYTHENGKIEINMNVVNNVLQISVKDNGIGIRTDEINNLFKKYGQTTNNFKLSCSSNGLGLCVSQKIAHLLGGHISVQSEYNKGSCFTFHHPLTFGQSTINNSDSDSESDISPRQLTCKTYEFKNNVTIKKNILIVDDNESNLTLLKMLLQDFNYELDFDLNIDTVQNGYDAVQICKINNYDCIFMDINMDGMDGCTTCEMIKNNNKDSNIKFIAATGNIFAVPNNNTNNNQKYKIFDDVMIKPYCKNSVLYVFEQIFKK